MKQPGKISRRDMIAALGLTGAAAMSGGMLEVFGGEPSVSEAVYGGEEPIADADCVSYRYSDGQIERTVGEKLREFVSVKDYGAKGNGIADDTDAVQAAMRDNRGRTIYFPAGVYLLSDTLEMDGHCLIGDGVDQWIPAFPDQAKKEEIGTHLRFVGTGAKRYEMKYTSDMRTAGGWRHNPDGSGATENQHYQLLNFMNEDATGTTPATMKKISAAICVLPTVQRWGIKNLRIVPDYDGLNGYNEKRLSLAADWDVGVYCNSAEFGVMEDVQLVGYWRMAALLQGHAQNDAGRYEAGAEYNRYIRCMFQGFRGVSVRGGDYFQVTGVTVDTIEIPWSASNPIPQQSDRTRGIALRQGSTIYDWTDSIRAGDKLILTGVTPNPTSMSVGILRNNIYTTGNAGLTFEQCYICGLEHTRLVPSNLLGLGIGVSIPIELNGVRGARFTNCKIQTIEEAVVFMHEADDTVIDLVEFDLTSWKYLDGTPGQTGARFLAADSWMTDASAPYPAGNTSNLKITQSCVLANGLIDLEPYVTRTTSRFTSGALFRPNQFALASTQFPSSTETVIRMLKQKDFRVQTEDGTTQFRMTSSGNAIVTGQLTVGVSRTGTINSDGSNNLALRTGTTTRLQLFGASGNVAPGADNTQAFGTSALRWSTMYAGTGTINTSDRNEKQQIRSIEDAVLDAWSEVRYVQFKFNDAVSLKGCEARWHIGVIAQEIQEAFERHGIDAFAFGLLCLDEYELERESSEIEAHFAAGNGEEAADRGKRYSIRPDECMMLESAWMRREMERLKARVYGAYESQT